MQKQNSGKSFAFLPWILLHQIQLNSPIFLYVPSICIDSVINTDGWRGYDGLVDIGFDKHLRVNHSDNEFACGERHINGIESFWGYAKKRLSKFNGIDKKMFYLHLKETEYRFNHRHGNLYLDLLKLLRNSPL